MVGVDKEHRGDKPAIDFRADAPKPVDTECIRGDADQLGGWDVELLRSQKFEGLWHERESDVQYEVRVSRNDDATLIEECYQWISS